MKNGQAVLCLAGGYLLGRFHKARWALGLAGLAAGKRLRSGPGGAAAGLLKPPALGQFGNLRGELLVAGKSAAVVAASNRIDSLSERLLERAESLRAGPAQRPTGEAERLRPQKERPAGEPEERRSEREEEIARRRAERLRARPSSAARRTTQTSRGARRTAASERSGGRPGRDRTSATGESPRRSRG